MPISYIPNITNIFNKRLNPLKAITIAAAMGLILFTYFNFSSYKPKVLKQVSEVKSYKTQDPLLSLPYMTGAKEIGVNDINGGRQTTLEVANTPGAVRSFYKNVFLDKGWVMATSSTDKNSLVDGYTQGNYGATVVISKADAISNTVVGINITKSH
jgi:hypothetical protein